MAQAQEGQWCNLYKQIIVNKKKLTFSINKNPGRMPGIFSQYTYIKIVINS